MRMRVIPTNISKDSDDYLKQAIVGLLLGDGSLIKKYVNGGTYFKFAQSDGHVDYLNHVFNLFKDKGLLNMTKPSKVTSILKNKEYISWQFSTKSIKQWNKLHKIWYLDGIKGIPLNIFETLTPVGLAYWLIDDGGWTGKGIHLATNAFTKEDLLRLIDVLQNKFKLDCSIHSRNRVYIKAKSRKDFINLVEPYVHPSMKYKVNQI